MPDVRLPDGRVIRNVPKGTTKSQLMAKVGKLDATQQPKQETQEQPVPQESIERTALEQGLQGATFGFADEITDRLGAGIAALATDESYSDLLAEARGESQNRLKRQFEQNPKTAIAANIGGALLTGGAGATTKTGTALANSLRTGNTTARIGKGALVGAASGATFGAGTAEEGERVSGAIEGGLTGAALGGAIPAVGATARGVKNAIVPQIDDALKPLAKRARDFGIPLRADQVAPTRVRNTLQKVSQELPFSGVDAFEDTQRKAFTKAVARTIGESADDLSPETIQTASQRISGVFDDALKGRDITVDRGVIDKIKAIASDADEALTGERSAIVKRQVDNFLADIGENATISGDKLADFRSRIIKIAPRAEGGAREFLSDIAATVDDSIKGGLPEEKLKSLNEARRQYRNLKTIEPLLEASTDGQINPTQLLSRVKSSKFIKSSKIPTGEDDIVDLARIGKEFLPKKGGSDSAQKIGLGAYATGAGTIYNLPGTAAALAANRVIQSGVNQNQRLIDAALRVSKNPVKQIGRTPVNPLIAASQAGGQ